ncbi:MAG: nitroreductase family deazaflavin-dependent oxidoreductase [Nitriliruptorales bacterium]
MAVHDAPRGRGPYGITTTPDGSVFYASLAGSHIATIAADGSASVVEPPTADQGARRVWADSRGAVWVAEWNSGNLSRYEPESGAWTTWRLPGDDPAVYAVFVDDRDIVWATDFGSNSIVRFDPATEAFDVYPLPHDPGEVRQVHGRPGEVWGAESAADNLVLIPTASPWRCLRRAAREMMPLPPAEVAMAKTKTYRLTPVIRIFNRLMRLLSRTPLAPAGVHELTTTGRRSGQPRTTPVRLLDHEGQRWLVSPYGTVGWVHNVRINDRVTFRRRGRAETLRAEEVDAATAAPVLREYLRAESFVRLFFDAEADDPIEAFEAEADRHPVFRLTAP